MPWGKTGWKVKVFTDFLTPLFWCFLLFFSSVCFSVKKILACCYILILLHSLQQLHYVETIDVSQCAPLTLQLVHQGPLVRPVTASAAVRMEAPVTL